MKVLMHFANERESGPGIPLPANACRLYKSDVDESKQLIVKRRIEHTPMDETITLTAQAATSYYSRR